MYAWLARTVSPPTQPVAQTVDRLPLPYRPMENTDGLDDTLIAVEKGGGGGTTHVSRTLKSINNASLRLKFRVHTCTEIPKVKELYFADFGFVFLPFTLKTFNPMIT